MCAVFLNIFREKLCKGCPFKVFRDPWCDLHQCIRQQGIYSFPNVVKCEIISLKGRSSKIKAVTVPVLNRASMAVFTENGSFFVGPAVRRFKSPDPERRSAGGQRQQSCSYPLVIEKQLAKVFCLQPQKGK